MFAVLLCGVAGSDALAQAGSGHAGVKAGKATLAEKLPAFDVVSIRPSVRPGFGAQFLPDGYSAHGQKLHLTLMMAYFPMSELLGFSGNPISGEPAWVNKDRYDIDAKIDAATVEVWKNKTDAQRREMLQPMLQAMLAERCKLAARMTMVQQPVFELVVGKHGPKMKPTPGDEAPPAGSFPTSVGSDSMMVPIERGSSKPQLVFFRTSMAELAKRLSAKSSRQVVDHTGLTGKFDLAVPLIEAIASPTEGSGAASDPADSQKWDVSEAGLELRRAKAPVEMLVIDRIEKPSEN
jgi:uncharacterized protein (TIGR03435 family)